MTVYTPQTFPKFALTMSWRRIGQAALLTAVLALAFAVGVYAIAMGAGAYLIGLTTDE